MILGDKQFEQFVNTYVFRMRHIHSLRSDIERLIKEGHKAKLLMEIMPVKTPEYASYVAAHGIPETDAEFADMFIWCLKSDMLLFRNYLIYILSVEHEIATTTYQWLTELKDLFDLTPKVLV